MRGRDLHLSGLICLPSSPQQANSAYRKYELPDRLTPEMIKSLLTEMRGDAIKRNIIKQPVRGVGTSLGHRAQHRQEAVEMQGCRSEAGCHVSVIAEDV